MQARPQTPRATGGVVLNAIAIVAALLAAPYLLVPLLKLGFVGLVTAAPVALVVYLVGFLVIDVGPVVGIALSIAGKARPLGYVTGAASLVSLVALIGAVAALKTRMDLDGDGRARGPEPARCAPRVADASAIGRKCDADAGAAPAGDCPAEHFCLQRVMGRPDSFECRAYCSHDCECPSRTKCVYGFCERR
jgi:hypothetical protein